MADPLSITSGVVGILSLGIQVTQGLTTYYGLWKSHEDTLIHHDIRLDQLEKSLGILQTSISKLDHKDSLATQNVASTIVACENGMKKLKSSLDQCRLSPAQPGLHHRVRDTSRKALFPFKKATLDSLRSTVTELQSNVDNALQILGMYVDVRNNCDKLPRLMSLIVMFLVITGWPYLQLFWLLHGLIKVSMTPEAIYKALVKALIPGLRT